MTITTTETTTVEALRERAIALGVEDQKALRAGDFEAPVREMAYEAFTAAHTAGVRIGDLADAVTLRYAVYLLNTLQPGFVQTLALDGDLEHPTNAFGETVDLTGAAA